MAWEVDEWSDDRGIVWTVRFRDGDHYPIRLHPSMNGSLDDIRAAMNRVCEALNRADDREALLGVMRRAYQTGDVSEIGSVLYEMGREQARRWADDVGRG